MCKLRNCSHHGLAVAGQSVPTGSQYRLPRDIWPLHYELELTPDFEHLTFWGNVAIDVDVRNPALMKREMSRCRYMMRPPTFTNGGQLKPLHRRLASVLADRPSCAAAIFGEIRCAFPVAGMVDALPLAAAFETTTDLGRRCLSFSVSMNLVIDFAAFFSRRDFSCVFVYRDGQRLLKAVTRPVVFSHRHVDPGARQLLAAAEVGPGMHGLDIGGGTRTDIRERRSPVLPLHHEKPRGSSWLTPVAQQDCHRPAKYAFLLRDRRRNLRIVEVARTIDVQGHWQLLTANRRFTRSPTTT